MRSSVLYGRPCELSPFSVNLSRRRPSQYRLQSSVIKKQMRGAKRKYHLYNQQLTLVGAEGFEPPTLCSQSRCATRLRYAPMPAIPAFFAQLVEQGISFDCNPAWIPCPPPHVCGTQWKGCQVTSTAKSHTSRVKGMAKTSAIPPPRKSRNAQSRQVCR
jgi:hypothetical protein